MYVSDYYVLLTIVNSTPTIKLLQSSKIISTIGSKWYELGIALLDEDQIKQLEIIKVNNSEVTRCCTTMLNFWLESHSKATWQDLKAALESPGVDLLNVATMIEGLFQG